MIWVTMHESTVMQTRNVKVLNIKPSQDHRFEIPLPRLQCCCRCCDVFPVKATLERMIIRRFRARMAGIKRANDINASFSSVEMKFRPFLQPLLLLNQITWLWSSLSMAPPVPLQYPWHWGKRGKYSMYLCQTPTRLWRPQQCMKLWMWLTESNGFCIEPLPPSTKTDAHSEKGGTGWGKSGRHSDFY